MEDKDKSLAALNFYIEAGVDEIIGYEPVDHLNSSQATALPQMANVGSRQVDPVSPTQSFFQVTTEAVESAKVLASGAGDLAALCEAMNTFDACSFQSLLHGVSS